MKKETRRIVQGALIASIYVVITLALSPFAYGMIQVRISEALTLLPFYLGSWSAVALWIGCMIANFGSQAGIIDIIFGALITLIAGLLTARARNKVEAGIYPVLLNAFGIGAILYYTLGLPFWLNVLYVGLGQFISVYIIGIPLFTYLNKKINLKKLID
ncbi:MAG: QueT transporter family protein [Halothermotrichaceae bacterium]